MTKIIKTTAIAVAFATLSLLASASAMPRLGDSIPAQLHHSKLTFGPALKGEHGGHGSYHPVQTVPGAAASGTGPLPAGTLSTAGGTCSCGR